jgi:hypothetical protein
VLWHSNCSLTPAREGLIHVEDAADVAVQNNTIADNDVFTTIDTSGVATLKVWDSIIADAAGAFVSDDGIVCLSSGSHNLDEIGHWNLAIPFTSCPASTTYYNADPLFVTSTSCVFPVSRPYYFSHSRGILLAFARYC